MPTIRDVARHAGVSVATVSAVINKNKYVSPALLERVERAIEALDYRPSRLGRALSLKRSFTLGFLVPTITNPFFPSIVKSVEDVAFLRGYGLMVCNTEDDAERVAQYRDSLLSAHIDGLLMTLSSEVAQPDVYQPFLDRGIPVVGLAGARILERVDCVITNDVEGARNLAGHVLSLGHRRIGYIGVNGSRSSGMRRNGIQEAMEAVGTSLDERFVRLCSGYAESDAYAQTNEILNTPKRPTALICYNDVMAVGAMRACMDFGLQIPDDISVTGYDNTLGEYTFPRLTTMAVPTGEMGELAANIVLDRVEEKHSEPPTTHRFLPRLKVRSTTGPPVATGAARHSVR